MDREGKPTLSPAMPSPNVTPTGVYRTLGKEQGRSLSKAGTDEGKNCEPEF